MKHKEYIRKTQGSREAVIFIHGILGTPNQFRFFVPLVPTEIDVYNIVLPGHSGTIKDFANSSMEKWREYAFSYVDRLCEEYRGVYIVAHSMGTLFAIQSAIKYPEKIKQLFLLASPLKLFIKPRIVRTSLRVIFGNEEKIKNDPDVMEVKDASGVVFTKNIFHYLSSIPRFFELFSEIHKTRRLIDKLPVRTVVYQSKDDEMVTRGASKYLLEKKNVELHVLPTSRHFYYGENDLSFLVKSFKQMLSSVYEGK